MKRTTNGVRQLLRFTAVGCLNTFVDYAVFYLLISFAGLHKSIAQVFATAVAMCGSFFINRRWTFGKTGRGVSEDAVKFICVNIASMLTSIAFTHLFHDILRAERVVNALFAAWNIPYLLGGNSAVMLAKIFASVFSVAVSFLGNKFWVFRTKKGEKRS